MKKGSTNVEPFLCAQDWIRTSTPMKAPPPQSGLSTNFNTWACMKFLVSRFWFVVEVADSLRLKQKTINLKHPLGR